MSCELYWSNVKFYATTCTYYNDLASSIASDILFWPTSFSICTCSSNRFGYFFFTLSVNPQFIHNSINFSTIESLIDDDLWLSTKYAALKSRSTKFSGRLRPRMLIANLDKILKLGSSANLIYSRCMSIFIILIGSISYHDPTWITTTHVSHNLGSGEESSGTSSTMVLYLLCVS